ncbi:hypothetical protein M0R45_018748 [Rubus argutus]|uniref:Uncharacterized protein n=1 Tax=Rubus argutus TaxID=59490 RepID=A0AAW1X4R7_RUBAR
MIMASFKLYTMSVAITPHFDPAYGSGRKTCFVCPYHVGFTSTMKSIHVHFKHLLCVLLSRDHRLDARNCKFGFLSPDNLRKPIASGGLFEW